MPVRRFTSEFEGVGRLYGRSAEEQRRGDAGQTQPLQRWIAVENDVVTAVATSWLRPDDRLFLMLAGDIVGSIGALAAASDVARSVHVLADYDDIAVMRAMTECGFRVEMVSEAFRVRFDRVIPILERAKTPSGFAIRGAAEADEDRLFELDNATRGLVQGTDGWRGDRAWFHQELMDAPPFDPAAYLVAIEAATGTYAGLVRVWRNPSGPRLGLVAVLPRFRSTTIAAVLLRDSLRAAATWGHETFVTETSLENRVFHHRMRRYGAQSTGRFAQLMR